MTRAALVLALVIAAHGRARADLAAASPGPLAAPHAAIESQCRRCHVPFGGIPDRQCLACHTRLAERTARGLGLHAAVKAQPCTACHQEHHGRDAQLAAAPPPGFDHRTTAFPLDGDHARLACERCHPAAGASRRWVGIATTCQSCHADRAHKGALGSDCARCHRASGWAPALFTARDHRLPMTGGHAKAGCADCHRSGLHLVERETCASCHAQPHGGTSAACETCHRVAGWTQVAYSHRSGQERLPGKHQSAACLACHPAFQFRPTSLACATCHDRDRAHEPLGDCEGCHSAVAWTGAAFDHDQASVGFALTGRHRDAPCARCHTTRGTFLGASHACAGCHADPHRGQFAGRRRPAADAPSLLSRALAMLSPGGRAAGCADCHTTAGWRPSQISRADHAALGVPLRGAHATTACRTCHADGRFVGAPRACAGCHADVRHRGRFGSDCASCHDEIAWSRTARFDHARTGFALDGAHAPLACAACHGSGGLRLAEAAAPTACRTCHAPPHSDQLGARCTECHSTASFAGAPAFDHAARTDFPLELRHRALRCVACHDARRPTAHAACRTCHGDPHRGSNAFDCSDCHRPDRWRLVRFDHDLTSYPLVGRHRITACGGCHSNPTWTGVRSDCIACHALDRPRDAGHTGELVCDDCHDLTSWRTTRNQMRGRMRGGR